MIEPLAWTARTFAFDLPVECFPAVLARLRGTPPRAEALVQEVGEEALSLRDAGRWSVKEHIGHLDDLEELDRNRLKGFLARVPILESADPTNRRTEEATHNAKPISEIVGRLRDNREALVAQLETLTEDEVLITSLHPRLKTPMRLIDWAQFVAEHDDHHLAHAHAILQKHFSKTPRTP